MRLRQSLIATLLMLAVGLSTDVSADLYWDSNGSNGGGSDTDTATGTWGVDNFWSGDMDGNAATGAWVADETAVFSAGSNVTGTYTVTVDGMQSASGIDFQEGTVTLNGGTVNLTNAATINVVATDLFTGVGTATINSIISGSAGLNQTGAGTLVLGGANTYSGNTRLATNTNAGTFNILRLGASEVIPDTSILEIEGMNSRFELNGQTETVKSIANINTGSGALTGSAIVIGTGTLILDDELGEVSTYEGSVFSSSTGKIIKNGDGQINLTATNDAWDGEFVLNSGILGIGAANTLGTSTNGDARLTINGGTIQRVATTGNLTLQTQNVDIGGDFAYGGTGTQQFEFFGSAESTPFGNEGSVIVTLKDSVSINVPNAGTFLIFRGRVLSEGQERGITKIGSGVLTLRHPNNAYGGDTTIMEGQLRIDADAPLGDGTGTLNLAGGSLNTTATRDVTNAPVVNPVNVTANSAITTTNGAVANVELNLTSNGVVGSSGATLTFQNLAAAGTNQFEPRFSGTGFNLASPIDIAAGLNAATRTTRLSSANASGTQTFSGAISGAGKFRRMTAGGTTVLTGANTYSGGTEVEDGTLTVSGSSATLGTGNVTVTGGILDIAAGVANAIADTATLSISGTGIASLGAGINDTITALSLGGMMQTSGTYGSSSSPAMFQLDQYFTGMGMVTVAAAGVDGDYNDDGIVDAADYVIWRKNDGTNNPLPNDNGLGVPIGTAHYELWVQNFGNTSGSGGGANTAVPEPASLALVMLAIAPTLAGLRRSRRVH